MKITLNLSGEKFLLSVPGRSGSVWVPSITLRPRTVDITLFRQDSNWVTSFLRAYDMGYSLSVSPLGVAILTVQKSDIRFYL